MPFLARVLTTLALGSLMMTTSAYAADRAPIITVGTQEVGLTAGYMLPHPLTQDHTTKQQGPAFMPSWMMTVTDPVGDGCLNRRRDGLYPVPGTVSYTRSRLHPENQIYVRGAGSDPTLRRIRRRPLLD